MSLKNYRTTIRNNLKSLNKIEGKRFITGEKNLKIKREDFFDKVEELENGKQYVSVIRIEHRILEGQGLISYSFEKDGVYFHIPDWDGLISAVNAFFVACGPY